VTLTKTDRERVTVPAGRLPRRPAQAPDLPPEGRGRNRTHGAERRQGTLSIAWNGAAAGLPDAPQPAMLS
jgi:hypothetical protein